MISEDIRLHLAPMEGVVDPILRDLLTQLGGIDQCTTEFIRVTNQLLPPAVFLRYCPELKTNSRTPAGTPVFIQLLGSDPACLADNAAQAAALGAYGIDLNFGCPAKIVNRHRGGAILLKEPKLLYEIVQSVRKAVPATIPVTAKIRLGYDSYESCRENAQAVTLAGANKLTVHCRTKMDMYQPPAHWHWIEKIKEVTEIPIIANGDIFNQQDLQQCQQTTKCTEFMIGRGVLRNPFLFLQLKNLTKPFSYENFVLNFFHANKSVSANYAVAKTKQLLRQMALYPQTAGYFEQLKTETRLDLFEERLSSLLSPKLKSLGDKQNHNLL